MEELERALCHREAILEDKERALAQRAGPLTPNPNPSPDLNPNLKPQPQTLISNPNPRP